MKTADLRNELDKNWQGMLLWGGFIQVIQGIGLGVVVAQFLIPFMPMLFLPVWITPFITIPILIALTFSRFYWGVDDKAHHMKNHINTLDDPYRDRKDLWSELYDWRKESELPPEKIRDFALDFHEGLEGRFKKYSDLLKEFQMKGNVNPRAVDLLYKYKNKLKTIENEYFASSKFRYGSGEMASQLDKDSRKYHPKKLYREAYYFYKDLISLIQPLINLVLGGFFAISLYNLATSVVAVATITAAFPIVTAACLTFFAIAGWIIFQFSETEFQPKFKQLGREIKEALNNYQERSKLINWRCKQILANNKLNEFYKEFDEEINGHGNERVEIPAFNFKNKDFDTRVTKPQNATGFWKTHRRTMSAEAELSSQNTVQVSKKPFL